MKWCSYCRKATHSDDECWSTRPADWKPTLRDVQTLLPVQPMQPPSLPRITWNAERKRWQCARGRLWMDRWQAYGPAGVGPTPAAAYRSWSELQLVNCTCHNQRARELCVHLHRCIRIEAQAVVDDLAPMLRRMKDRG